MAITKTKFINYSKCPRYVALDKVKHEKLDAEINYKEYLKEEKALKLNELVSHMYDEDDEDLIDLPNPQLESMMKYYNLVEKLAGDLSLEYFGGTSIYAEDTKEQKLFTYDYNGYKYLCYIDVYNKNETNVNIIEVKATTTNKFMSMGPKIKGEHYSIFEKKNNILYLKDELGYDIESTIPLTKYYEHRNKLFDRFKDGKYVYDLAVQRFIIEGSLKQNKISNANYKYYLAVLNHEYVFDGKYVDGEPIYDADSNGNEIISYIDLTNVTLEYQERILGDVKRVEEYISNMDASSCPLGKYCEYKQRTECKYFKPICGSMIPKSNSSLNYMDNGFGFKVGDARLKGLDLINEGYINMLDIPEDWLSNQNHFIQREALKTDTPYIDKDKIKLGLEQLEYPIYHLDFETFPCPVPRFKGERPYTQSPFEFSLHIENSPGVCDKENDNYVFLARSFDDEREELIKAILKYIDPNKGTLFAQNVSFEKGRLKELSDIFLEYKTDLTKIMNRGFDLIWLVKTSTKMYEELGLESEDAKKVNYYHKNLSGSYSIKKTLPVFSDLKYDDLDVKNGTEAIIEYANYPKMDKSEFEFKYNALVEYCKQDTWAMVIILDKLRELCK